MEIRILVKVQSKTHSSFFFIILQLGKKVLSKSSHAMSVNYLTS